MSEGAARWRLGSSIGPTLAPTRANPSFRDGGRGAPPRLGCGAAAGFPGDRANLPGRNAPAWAIPHRRELRRRRREAARRSRHTERRTPLRTGAYGTTIDAGWSDASLDARRDADHIHLTCETHTSRRHCESAVRWCRLLIVQLCVPSAHDGPTSWHRRCSREGPHGPIGFQDPFNGRGFRARGFRRPVPGRSGRLRVDCTTSNCTVDFLFVIDNSVSMGSHQNALAQAAEEMTAQLASDSIDWRIAVTYTDLRSGDVAERAPCAGAFGAGSHALCPFTRDMNVFRDGSAGCAYANPARVAVAPSAASARRARPSCGSTPAPAARPSPVASATSARTPTSSSSSSATRASRPTAGHCRATTKLGRDLGGVLRLAGRPGHPRHRLPVRPDAGQPRALWRQRRSRRELRAVIARSSDISRHPRAASSMPISATRSASSSVPGEHGHDHHDLRTEHHDDDHRHDDHHPRRRSVARRRPPHTMPASSSTTSTTIPVSGATTTTTTTLVRTATTTTTTTPGGSTTTTTVTQPDSTTTSTLHHRVRCTPGTDGGCDDGDSCTQDTCSSAGGASTKPSRDSTRSSAGFRRARAVSCRSACCAGCRRPPPGRAGRELVVSQEDPSAGRARRP